MKKKLRMTAVDYGVLFFIAVIGLTEVVHLSSMIFHQKFHVTAGLLGLILAGLAVLCIAAVLCGRRFAWGKSSGAGVHKGTPKLYVVLIIGLILFQIIWNFYMHSPYVTGDITIETVQTILATDTVYEYNPMTGGLFEAGMPSRLMILVLPVLYSAVARWTGLPAQTVVYEWVSTIVLCLSYLVYAGWAGFLFPGDRKKQCRFLLLVVLLYQFGAYAPLSDGMRALQAGYTGESIRALVLLPYVLLCCVQKKWLQAVLGAMAEVCIVWTLYGLGYSVFVIFFTVLLFWVISAIGKRRKGGSVS
ncbi:MAG: hypothetical protein E7293_04635 [Lachnospiraceae bacterium]|nr:hypothetical protein [Lachnospiraceae bacterium]